MTNNRVRQRGFSIIELLVVIAIIAILLGLIMPAIQTVREGAQRTACANNLGQMSKAWLNHEQTYGHLPTGGWGWHWNGDPNQPLDRRQPGGWGFNILPFLGQQQIFAMGSGLPAAQKQAAVAQRLQTVVPQFNCPSRRRNQLYPNIIGANPGFYFDIGNIVVPAVARSDYGANVGSQAQVEPNAGQIPTNYTDGLNDNWPGWVNTSTFNGICFQRSEIRSADIVRGRSSVYMLGEKFLERSSYNTGNSPADNENLYTGFNNDNYRSTVVPPIRDQRIDPNDPNLNASYLYRFGSPHRDGTNMSFCDGSVRLVPFNVDPQVHLDAGKRR